MRVSVADLSIGRDSEGRPAVDGELADSEKARFGEWTGKNIDESMVIIVGGKFVTLATLKARLPAKFQISGGPEGFPSTGVEVMIATIREGR